MKRLPVIAAVLFLAASTQAQNVGIGTDTPHPSAKLEIASNSSGVLVPRMTASSRDGIMDPAEGLLVFVTDDSTFYYFNGNDWVTFDSSTRMLVDADGDTRVDVEQSPDEDVIRFSTAGTEYFNMTGPRLEVTNAGNSVFIGDSAGQNDDLADNRNVFIGHLSGFSNTSGFFNAALGFQAFFANQGGGYNVAFGYRALRNSVGGSWNTGTGFQALYSNTTGGYNTSFGANALFYNTTGEGNTASGYRALLMNKTASYNTSIGYEAMLNDSLGSSNVAIGVRALFNTGDRSNLVAIGDSALYNNGSGVTVSTEATNNTAVGSKALYANTTGRDNTALGRHALKDLAAGEQNVAIGSGVAAQLQGTKNTATGADALRINVGDFNSAFGAEAMALSTGGGGNTAAGYRSLHNNRDGHGNAAFAQFTLLNNNDGIWNTAIGGFSMLNNTDGSFNSGLGCHALWGNTTGQENAAVGYSALRMNTTGSVNVAVGAYALYNNTVRSNLVAVGDSALYHNGTDVTLNFQARNNTAVGSKALYSNTTGAGNTAIGSHALDDNSVGNFNTALGQSALGSNTVGIENNALGFGAMLMNISGHHNTAFGYQALYSNTSGDDNTALGYQAGYSATGMNNVFLGYNAGYGELGDNKLYIENSSSNNPLIYGDFAGDSVSINGKLTANGNLAIHSGDIQVNENSVLFSDPENGDGTVELAVSDSSFPDEGVSLRAHTNPPSGEPILRVMSSGGVERLRVEHDGMLSTSNNLGIDGTGDSYLMGNVGIGTIAPSAQLHVSGGDALLDRGSAVNFLGRSLTIGGAREAGGNSYARIDFQNYDNNGSAVDYIGAQILSFNAGGNDKGNLVFKTYDGTLNTRMTITPGGDVGIGTTAPTAQLHTTGSVRFANFASGDLWVDASGNVVIASDERWKDIQGSFDSGLAELLQIDPIQYTWKASTGYDTVSTYTGFSAQNVQRVIPEAIGVDGNGYLTFSERPVIAALVNAVKELNAENQSLRKKNETLTSEHHQMRSELDRLDSLEDKVRELQDLVLQSIQDGLPRVEALEEN